MTVTAAAPVTRTAAHTPGGSSNSPHTNADTGVSGMQAAAALATTGADTACVGQPAPDSDDIMDNQEDASRKRQRSDSTSDSGTDICHSRCGRRLQHSVCVTPSSHTTSGDSLTAAGGGALTATSDDSELAL